MLVGATRLGMPPQYRDRTYRRPRADEFTWYNPGSRFTGGASPVENGGGTAMTVSLVGSVVIASTANPDFAASCYGIMPLQDAYGVQITGDVAYAMGLRMRFGTAPVVGDNVLAAMGIINESDLTGTTVDGNQFLYDATAAVGASPRIRAHTISDGATGGATNGAVTATVAGGAITCLRNALGASDGFRNGVGLDTSRGTVAGAGITPTAGVQLGTGGRWLFVAFDRTLVSDTDAISFDFIAEIQRIIPAAA